MRHTKSETSGTDEMGTRGGINEVVADGMAQGDIWSARVPIRRLCVIQADTTLEHLVVVISGKEDSTPRTILHILDVHNAIGRSNDGCLGVCDNVKELEECVLLHKQEPVVAVGVKALGKSMGKLHSGASVDIRDDLVVGVQCESIDAWTTSRGNNDCALALKDLHIVGRGNEVGG